MNDRDRQFWDDYLGDRRTGGTAPSFWQASPELYCPKCRTAAGGTEHETRRCHVCATDLVERADWSRLLRRGWLPCVIVGTALWMITFLIPVAISVVFPALDLPGQHLVVPLAMALPALGAWLASWPLGSDADKALVLPRWLLRGLAIGYVACLILPMLIPQFVPAWAVLLFMILSVAMVWYLEELLACLQDPAGESALGFLKAASIACGAIAIALFFPAVDDNIGAALGLMLLLLVMSICFFAAAIRAMLGIHRAIVPRDRAFPVISVHPSDPP